MKTTSLYTLVSIFLSTISTFAQSNTVNAVIGLNNSQIVEDGQEISLTPNAGTLLPLHNNFSPISNLQNSTNKHWFGAIGKKISVEHKHRDLSYTGTLTKIENGEQSFVILINDKLVSLPLNDFYLIPLEKHSEPKAITAPYQISYQTNQLSWTPQLNLIFDNDQVTISQQAVLHNNSSNTINIQDSLLHYSLASTPQILKTERSTLSINTVQPDVNYQDNEISYPIDDTNISIEPYSNTLYSLPSSRSDIENQVQSSTLYTHNNSAGKVDAVFYNKLSFTLKQDGFPGKYKTFWKRKNLLIPSSSVVLNTVRANNLVEVTTNKSRDITGYITLIESSSKQLPSVQTWEATIQNHSSQSQKYSVEQNTNSIVNILSSNVVSQTNANSINISGNIKANATKKIIYKIELKK